MNDIQQVIPPPPSHSNKCKALEPAPPVNGKTTTKCTKASEPSGLVPNWKKNVGLLSHIAHKHPIEFVDKKDNLVKREFDKAERSDMLATVCASKPSTVRVKTKLKQMVSGIIISDWMFLKTVHVAWGEIDPMHYFLSAQAK